MAGQVLESEEEALSDINVVPLTDVMLVLLIVFLITTQVIKQARQENRERSLEVAVPEQ